MLSNIRIVLVNTSHPGNIGAVARAMKNMCLESLYLVDPVQFPHADATARASGADDLLARAVVCRDLEEALAGCALVMGASARRRSIPWPELDPRACAARLVDDAARGPVALVFGRERTGLTNEELDRCHFLVQIPSNPVYTSLNLAAAVQVLAYELLVAHGAPSGEVRAGAAEQFPPADADELERFYAHLETTLAALDFLDPANPKHLMRRLRRLFNRARPDRNEINILRGILTAADKAVRDAGGG